MDSIDDLNDAKLISKELTSKESVKSSASELKSDEPVMENPDLTVSELLERNILPNAPQELTTHQEIEKILNKHDGLESNIPIPHRYWTLLNLHRSQVK